MTLNCNRGFTTVEMLVTVGVLAALSAILIGYSRSGELNIILFKDQARVVNAILRAKSLAVQTYATGENVCGYGIHFDPGGSFIIFKDLAADCDSSDRQYSDPSEEVEVNKLDSKLWFSQLDISDALFVPPDPETILKPDRESGVIAITAASGASTVKIKINSAGQVTTQQ